MEPVTVSFAVTRDDFVDARTAQVKNAMTLAFRQTARIVGAYLLAFSFLLIALCVSRHWPAQWPAAVSAAGGVFLIFLLNPTVLSLTRLRAAEDFDSGRADTEAQTVRLFPDRVEVRSERYQADLPYRMLYGAYEDGSVFLLYTGSGECRCIPKRSMAPGDCERTKALLADRLKQKFIQEGAREWTK